MLSACLLWGRTGCWEEGPFVPRGGFRGDQGEPWKNMPRRWMLDSGMVAQREVDRGGGWRSWQEGQ